MVVNPTHYAVALAYEPDDFGLPQVVAKGVDDGALELRAFAHNQGIPIVANPPLARALYQVELGDAIPSNCSKRLRWCCAGSMDSVATTATATAMEPCHARRSRASDKVFRL